MSLTQGGIRQVLADEHHPANGRASTNGHVSTNAALTSNGKAAANLVTTLGGPAAAGITVPITSEVDIVTARQWGRRLASELGCTAIDVTMIATAISELARNIVLYARHGEIRLRCSEPGTRRAIVVVARDEGPGIADVPRALAGGYSTSGGLGLGLSGVRRLMDEFEIQSGLGKGTTVSVRRWAR